MTPEMLKMVAIRGVEMFRAAGIFAIEPIARPRILEESDKSHLFWCGMEITDRNPLKVAEILAQSAQAAKQYRRLVHFVRPTKTNMVPIEFEDPEYQTHCLGFYIVEDPLNSVALRASLNKYHLNGRDIHQVVIDWAAKVE